MRLVDRLVADPHPRVVRVLNLSRPADLLRGIPLVQQRLHRRPQHRVPGQLRRALAGAAAGRPARRACSGSYRPVRNPHVPAQLPAHRRGVPPDPAADLPHRQRRTHLPKPGDLIPLLPRQEPGRVLGAKGSVHPTSLTMHPIHQGPRHTRTLSCLRRDSTRQPTNPSPDAPDSDPAASPPCPTSAQRCCDSPLSPRTIPGSESSTLPPRTPAKVPGPPRVHCLLKDRGTS